MKRPIELRRLRDFGQIINDTFTFLKENFKPLMGSVLVICGFFIVLETITSVFNVMNKGSMYSYNSDDYDAHSRAVNYLVSLWVYIFILIMAHLCIYLVTYCYISVYIQKNNTAPTLAEVWGYFKYFFLRVLGCGIVIFVLACTGYMLCLIPGIYLMPIFSLIIPIIVIENASLRYSFNESFRLIKDNWWVVAGVIFIMWIIVIVTGLFVNIALRFVQTGTQFLSLKQFDTPLIIFFTALKNILILVYILPAIAISLCYFSLSEEKDGTGLLQRIERLGKTGENNIPTLPPEEY